MYTTSHIEREKATYNAIFRWMETCNLEERYRFLPILMEEQTNEVVGKVYVCFAH